MNNRSILVLEDNFIQRDQLTDLFSEEGYEVSSTSNLPEAFEALETTHIDIALLDIKIGKEDRGGIEVAKYIRKNKQMPFIYLTAHGEYFESARRTEPAEFITKPYREKEVIKVVEDIFGEWYSYNRVLQRNLVGGLQKAISKAEIAAYLSVDLITLDKIQSVNLLEFSPAITHKLLTLVGQKHPELFLKFEDEIDRFMKEDQNSSEEIHQQNHNFSELMDLALKYVQIPDDIWHSLPLADQEIVNGIKQLSAKYPSREELVRYFKQSKKDSWGKVIGKFKDQKQR